MVQSDPQCIVSLQEANRILPALGQRETLLPELQRRLELPANKIEGLQPQQHLEEPRRFSHVAAQLSRPRIGALYFWSGIALRRHQSRAQGSLQKQLLLEALRRVRHSLEQLQPPGEVTDRFGIGRAPDCFLPCPLPVRNRVRDQARLRVVMSE